MWRTTDDFWDNWKALKNEFVICNDWEGKAGDGCYPGCGNATPGEEVGIGAVERGVPRMSGFTKDEATHFNRHSLQSSRSPSDVRR